VKPLYGVFAILTMNGIIPLRNKVSEWATVVAKRNSTVHAATSLLLNYLRIPALVDFFPIHDPNWNGTPFSGLPFSGL
jgi:hypothetical protein